MSPGDVIPQTITMTIVLSLPEINLQRFVAPPALKSALTGFISMTIGYTFGLVSTQSKDIGMRSFGLIT